MRVLIIGAGAVGAVMATYLAKTPDVSRVIISDVQEEKARRFVDNLKIEKVSWGCVDANDSDQLMKATKGIDVVVNATRPKYNPNVMDAALKNAAHYQDLGIYDIPDPVEGFPKQLALSDEWRDADLTALTGTGVSPGITNVVAAEAADKLDRVDKICIRICRIAESKIPISTWAPDIGWTDVAKEPIVFENGEYRKYPPFSGEELYKFPDPFGLKTVVWTFENEVVTFPRFIGKGINYVDVKYFKSEYQFIKFMYQLGLLSEEPIEVKGAKVTPLDVYLKLIPPTLTMEEMKKNIDSGIITDILLCVIVEVEGKKETKKIHSIYQISSPSLTEIQRMMPGAGTSYATGISAAIMTKMLGKGEIKRTGVICPECLAPPERKEFMVELAKNDILIHERMERRLA